MGTGEGEGGGSSSLRKLRRRTAVCAVVITALAAAAPAQATPEDLFGYGGRTNAMGATGVAHATGYETAWHNPALASTIRKNKLTLGYGGAVYALDAVGLGHIPTAPAKGLYIGADIPIPFGGKLEDRIGVALAFYTPSDVIVRGRVLYPETPQFPIIGDRSQSLTIRGGLGADIGWGVRVGAGFAALAEIIGTVVAATDVTGRVGTRVEDQLVATYAPVFGATWDIPGDSKLRIGAAYRGKLAARFSVIVDGSKLSSLAIPLFNISGLAQYDPAQGALEIARVDPEQRNVLALQFVYKKWSDFPGVLEPTVVCSEGGAGSCGLVPPTIDWKDTFVVRVGAEQGIELAPGVVLNGRGGMFFETSPLPATVAGSEAFDLGSKSVIQVPTRYYDSARVAFTTGVGVSLGGPKKRSLPPLDIDFYAQYHVLLGRTITSPAADGTPLSSAASAGHIKVFGLTAGVKF